MHARFFVVLVSSAVVLASCTGVIGSDGSGKSSDGELGPGRPGTAPASFTCDPTKAPDELPLRRLSRLQYGNSVRDVIRAIAPGEADAILASVKPVLDRMPDDQRIHPFGEKRGGFRRLDQTVQQDFVNVGYDVAVAVGKQLTASPARIEALAGACATDGDASNDATCLDEFIEKVGRIVHRRPLEERDVALYRDTAGADLVKPEALADVVAQMLAGPWFLYHVEHGKDVASGATYRLSGYELASRLSYHFWQTMPDEALLAAAASGALETEEGYAKEVKRLFDDPRTLAAIDDFVTEWLWLDGLPEMDARVGDKVYDAFANGLVPTGDTREHLVSDVLEAVHHVVRSGGAFADLFTESGSFAKDDDVAAIYGVSKWTGGDPVKTGPERVGLLTRPALLASGSASTRPVMKGVFVRLALLCDEIPPPPNNASSTPLNLSPTMTTREVVEAITEQPGTACAGCHKPTINPLGFATENFDALGRHRTVQRLFDELGNEVAEKPVDTTSVPRVAPGDDRPSAGAADLTRFLIDSGRVQACFARQYFRWTFERGEDDGKDGCALGAVSDAAKAQKSMSEVLMAIAMQPSFQRRTIP